MPRRLKVPGLTWQRGLLLVVATLGAAVALAQVYQLARAWWPEPWLAAAIVHTVLAAGVLAYASVTGRYAALQPEPWAKPWLVARPWLPWLPAGLVLFGSVVLAQASRMAAGSGAVSSALEPVQWAWIFWVPLVEEIVFRGGFGAALRRIDPVWALWFSSVLFAAAHADPSWARLIAGDVGTPLGPFLLGLSCAGLFAATGRLGPAVALHAACNATVVIFAAGDARWLEWLGFLYG